MLAGVIEVPRKPWSLGMTADKVWKSFYPVPFCFMGMGIFRVWTETLYANGQIGFPALEFSAPLPFFDAYALFDYLSVFVLILLAVFAKRLAPLYSRPWAIAATAVAMIGAACLNFASIFHPELAGMLRWPAIISGSIGISFILMLWSEFFGCINPLRVAGYYAAGIVVSCLVLWAFKGLSLPWLWVGTCLVPIVSLLCLWRSYLTLPADGFPPAYQHDYSFPWKPVVVIGIYSFVYGMRNGVFMSPLSMNSGMGAFVGAAVVYVLVSRLGEKLDFSLLWKIAMPLMLISLAPLDGLVERWAAIADTCALTSYTILLLLLMVIMSNLSYRYGVCALWIFAIERAVRMAASQTGRIAGSVIDVSSLPAFAQFLVLLGMAGLLVFVACFFFSEKSVTSPWGVVLKHTIADDRELYLKKNRTGLKCKELGHAHQLTSREEEVLTLIAQGKRLSQIADELSISTNTVKTHTRHVYTKLEINSRNELNALLGIKRGDVKR